MCDRALKIPAKVGNFGNRI